MWFREEGAGVETCVVVTEDRGSACKSPSATANNGLRSRRDFPERGTSAMSSSKTKTEPVAAERLLTYADAAELTAASERQVRRWVEEGKLGFVQLPRGRRITGRQLAEFIEACSVEPVA